ncbi:hypothetical protein MCHI_002196 [Candidatus Magnetoovum chiemensis]|nr:hypothetical protein MCHI_002196 [Candidatus Magnetoovum chiemensis]
MGGAHKKTRKRSKVTTELPQELRQEIDRLLIEGMTYEDISEFLKSKGYDISKSSIGRYGKDFLNEVRRLRIIEDQARTLVSEAGEGTRLIEAAEKLISRQLIELLLDNGVSALQLPKMVGEFAKLQTSTVVREKFKSDLKTKTERVFDKAQKNLPSMTKEEMLEMLKRDIYNLV